MEEIGEARSFWDYVPSASMPKAFMMTGKRREEGPETERFNDTDPDDDNSTVSSVGGNFSPNTSFTDDNDAPDNHHKYSSAFCSSTSSAFSKIEKSDTESDDNNVRSPFTSSTTPAFHGFPGFYPGFYPPFLSSHLLSASSAASASASPIVTSPSLSSATFPSHFYPGLPTPNLDPKPSSAESSPDKNMFYYVDPRIPFTNYFLNLTKLLNGSSKDYSAATTPLGKMADEELRADVREHPLSPQSSKSSPGKVSSTETCTSSHSHSESFKYSADNDSNEPKDLSKPEKMECAHTNSMNCHDKMAIPGFSDPRFINPFSGSIMQGAGHPGGMLPMPGTGLFHPAFMHLPGAGMRRYNPEKPPPVKKYKCDICGKAFSRSNTLVTHKRIHTGDKPFKCEICSRAFRQPGNLTRHRLTHTTVKPYVCPTCNKAFNRASNLHTHMRTHTSFKAFVCPYCGKGFHQKIDMKIHCYTHTAHTARPEATPI